MATERHEELEQEIRRRLEARDLAGTAALAIRGYGPEIYGFLVTFHRDEAEAAEVFSIFSERLWRDLPAFQGGSSLRTWAYVLARHSSLNQRRDERRRQQRQRALPEGSELSAIVERFRFRLRSRARSRLRSRARSRLRSRARSRARQAGHRKSPLSRYGDLFRKKAGPGHYHGSMRSRPSSFALAAAGEIRGAPMAGATVALVQASPASHGGDLYNAMGKRHYAYPFQPLGGTPFATLPDDIPATRLGLTACGELLGRRAGQGISGAKNALQPQVTAGIRPQPRSIPP